MFKDSSNAKQLLTAEELAEVLAVSLRLVRRLTAQNAIPAVYIGARLLRYDPDEVLESLRAKGRTAANAE